MLLAAPRPGSSFALGFTPAQVQTAYGINSISLAVDHRSVIGNGTGQTIAVIDVDDDPTIKSDLQAFDQHFGLPAPPSFNVVNQYGETVTPALVASGNPPRSPPPAMASL